MILEFTKIDILQYFFAEPPSFPKKPTVRIFLFLQNFIKPNTSWMHLDIMAWNLSYQPGRPIGGEAMTLRAFHHYLKKFIRKH